MIWCLLSSIRPYILISDGDSACASSHFARSLPAREHANRGVARASFSANSYSHGDDFQLPVCSQMRLPILLLALAPLAIATDCPLILENVNVSAISGTVGSIEEAIDVACGRRNFTAAFWSLKFAQELIKEIMSFLEVFTQNRVMLLSFSLPQINFDRCWLKQVSSNFATVICTGHWRIGGGKFDIN